MRDPHGRDRICAPADGNVIVKIGRNDRGTIEVMLLMNGRHAVIVAALLALSASLFAQGARRDGKWEVKMTMQTSGERKMFGASMAVQTLMQCVTKEEAADPSKAIPRSESDTYATTCKVSNYKVDGNKVTWLMTCEKDGVTGAGEFVYAGDTYTGSLTLKSMDGKGQAVKRIYSGKRLGDCTK